MQDQLIIKNEITIEADIAKVWDVLTNPEMTIQYMFGCEVLSDWAIGDPILWRGFNDDIIYVKGHVLELIPGYKLSYTTIDPTGTYPDVPANYLTVTYSLKQVHESTLLEVTQGDYMLVAEGEKRYKDSLEQGGWQSILEAVKGLSEKNTASDEI